MGRGLIKQRNTLKKKNLFQAVKYIEQLEKENQALKNDPQNAAQYQTLYSQNSRLSVLVACLIKKLESASDGSVVVVSVEEMKAFEGNRINIHWEAPEGVEHKDAKEYIFSYALAAEEPPTSPMPPEETVLIPPSPIPVTIEY